MKRLKIFCLPDNRIMIHVGEKLGFKYSMSELGVVRMILDLITPANNLNKDG